MKKTIILTSLILLLLLSSCSAQKKCERRIKKALPCIEYQSDTIIRLDTLYGFKTDTIFNGVSEVDTFYQDTGGVRVKTIVRWKDKTIYQNLIKRDTILKTKVITNTPKPVIKEVRPKWLTGLLAGLGTFILLLMFLVWAITKKRG